MREALPFLFVAAALCAQERPIVLKASTVFDGRGKTLHNTIIVVEGAEIARIGGALPGGAVVYDLSAFTLSPGWIDTHSHVANHFDNKDRLAGRDEPQQESMLHIADNLVRTIDAGFTTIQSPGATVTRTCARRRNGASARAANPHLAGAVD